MIIIKSSLTIFIDGKFIQNLQIPVSYLNENQVNIFETMLVMKGKIFRLENHLNRLFESAKTIGLTIPKSKLEIEKELKRALSSVSKSKQFFVTKGRRAVGDCPSPFWYETTCIRLTAFRDQIVIFIFKCEHNSEIYERGVDLNTSAIRRNTSESFRPEAKSGQFLNGILADLDPSAKNAFETLFLDHLGYVKEARVWNFFIVRRGCLQTPISSGILDGVTRRFVIECAQKEGIPVKETSLTRHDVWNAEEAFLTNTSGGIVPVRSLDCRQIGKKTPGVLTERLRRRFDNEFRREMGNSHASNQACFN